MAPIKGRLGDRKNATMELDGREIKLVVKGGFFGGKSSNRVIKLDDATSIKHGTGEKPFPDAMMIKIQYPEEELSFFSINKAPLEALAVEMEAFIEKRDKLLVEMEKEFVRDREAHVALLYLNLEFVEALMELVTRINGSVDWGAVDTMYHQVERVNLDRDNLTVTRPSHLSLERLSIGIDTRNVDIIKSEVYDLLFVLRESCAEKARHVEPWFNNVFHRLFLDSLFSFWGRHLESLTGAFSGESVENSEIRLQELGKLVHKEIGEDDKQLTTSQEYSENHRILFEWVEALQNVEFEPSEELEKRLAS
ncbi:MAG: hypothetical protein NWF07_09410 [Candidatus Bathyarchaeota archaeon]|nr:hypothetical protein [Candidatus Bathyarchaeota archaeon]